MSSQPTRNNRQRRNRKRSKRRNILCPVHHCYLDSAGPKYRLFADSAQQLERRGMTGKKSRLVINHLTTVPLDGEWLEPFWCGCCEETRWYHVCREGDRNYSVSIAPRDLWIQVSGVVNPDGNPSVGEFTRRSARMRGHQGMKQFSFLK